MRRSFLFSYDALDPPLPENTAAYMANPPSEAGVLYLRVSTVPPPPSYTTSPQPMEVPTPRFRRGLSLRSSRAVPSSPLPPLDGLPGSPDLSASLAVRRCFTLLLFFSHRAFSAWPRPVFVRKTGLRGRYTLVTPPPRLDKLSQARGCKGVFPFFLVFPSILVFAVSGICPKMSTLTLPRAFRLCRGCIRSPITSPTRLT